MAVRRIFPLLVLAAALGHSASETNQTIITVSSVTPTARCESITLDIPTCINVGWVNTSFPNLRSHTTQAEAYAELEDFDPLIKAKCSNKIVHFLCGVYAPVCIYPQMSDEPIVLEPCQSLCEDVRNACEPQLLAVGYSWPTHLSCDNFGPGAGCLDVDDDVEVPLIPGLTPSTTDEPSSSTSPVATPEPDSTNPPSGTGSSMESGSQTCPNDFVTVTVGVANNTYSLGGIDNCAVPCEGIYFTESQRNIVAPVFIMLCALICIGFTLFTVGTFLIDRQRFHYPERPVIFLAMCYLVLSVAYIVGTTVKLTDPTASFACSDYADRPPHFVFQRLPSSISSYHSASCVILFIIVYYFQMAAAIWWVMLTLTWFLASTLKWGEEAIERPWILYQIFSWSIPAIQVIFVLAFQLVDGDQLSGLCYTGNFSSVGSGVFVLLPLIVYLVLGVLFLVIGFISLVHIRLQISKDPVKSNRLQRLIIRICVYSLLYIIPNVLMLCLIIYEVAERNSWEVSYAECTDDGCSPETKPRFVAFLLRYLMLFMTGIFSTFWVISWKTFIAWKRFFSSIFCCQQEDLYVIPNKKNAIKV